MTNDSQTTNVSNMDFTSLVSAYFAAMAEVSDNNGKDYTQAEIYFDEIAQRCYKERKKGVKWQDSHYFLDYDFKILRYLSVLEA